MTTASSISLALYSALLPVPQGPPAGFGAADHVIEIGVLPARLRFDRERFAVAPGSKVQLTLINNGAMQHNLILCRPGKDVTQRVGTLALQLGAQASEKHFVPDSDLVLHHTRALLPGERDTLWFTAPEAPGDYPYVCTLPGHMYTMVGTMQVGDAGTVATTPLREPSYRVFAGRFDKLPEFDQLDPIAEGTFDDGVFDLSVAERQQNYGVRFDAILEIKTAGSYTFGLNSDDGSRLFIDEDVVTEWDGTHPGGDERTGQVTLTPGPHRLRLDFFQAGGGQLLRAAYQGPGVERTELTAAPAAGPPTGIPLAVHHHARVVRVHVEGAAARTLAVGLPGGTNYCFDAERCAVQFGWVGAFLDVGPDRLGRGGRPCKTLGPRFTLGDPIFPLRTASGGTQPVEFRGYRHSGTAPQLLLRWGEQELTWTITAGEAGSGLQYAFSLPQANTAVQFTYDPAMATCADATGPPGTVVIPAARAQSFTLTLTPRQEIGR